MRKARLILSASMLTLAAFSAITFSSCNKDEECAVGYEGKDCKDLTRDKFIGDWGGSDKCNLGTYNVDLEIKASSSDINALIVNIGGFGTQVVATGTVTGTNTLKITNEDLGGGRSLSGEMVFNGNNMTFTYDVDATIDPDDCIGTYTRK